jgi:UDP-N-acetylmuramate--alanine ligase
MGCEVTGTDLYLNELTRLLEQENTKIVYSDDSFLRENFDVVITTDAVGREHPVLRRARESGIPVLRRIIGVRSILRDRKTFVVAGSNGKSTTGGMLWEALEACGLLPTAILGASTTRLPLGGWWGEGQWAVVEGCEAYASLLELQPQAAVITNIAPDHLEYHGSFDALREVFRRFVEECRANRAPVIANADDPDTVATTARAEERILVGESDRAEYRLAAYKAGEPSVLVVEAEGRTIELTLPMPGKHNAVNALMAAAAARRLGGDWEDIQRGISCFSGLRRRFERLGQVNGAWVVDDYAHHPDGIRKTLEAVRTSYPERRLVCAFQPHLFSRTRLLFDEFAQSFHSADKLYILETYAAREQGREEIIAQYRGQDAARDLATAAATVELDKEVIYIKEHEELVRRLMLEADARTILVILGAGDITTVAHTLVEGAAA